ncbi:MAG: type II toxin-antitoxin system death-on-curing family toxin [Candidatus Rokuibacteriota bacterium]
MTARLRFLSPEQVVALHDAVLRQTGGLAGSGHRGSSYEGADAAVQAVKNSYYDTVEELAAAYAVYIVQGHVFADGNKRTGAAAMLIFLQANRGRTALSDEWIATLMIDLQRRAESGEDVARLIRWIAGELTAPHHPC